MDESRLVSASCRCQCISPEAFLASARGRERFYWRDDDVTLVGIGVAAEITAWGERRFDTVREKAEALFNDMIVLNADEQIARPRLFGGFSFQPEFITEHTWAQFAPALFVLPHYQLATQNGESWLTINVQLASDEPIDEASIQAALAEECALLSQLDPDSGSMPAPVRVEYPMSFGEWDEMIGGAVEEIRAGRLEKVVLSRVCELWFDDVVNVDAALAYLNDAYAQGSMRFLFEPIPRLAFFGATPELLIDVQDEQIQTMALAGSIRRGATSADDDMYAATLFADPKERHEHQVVVTGIRERLTPLTTRLDMQSEPRILRLKNIQHLQTPVSGFLRQSLGALPLVKIMHPTPALGGSPRSAALDFIRRAEPVPRGWYASPVGWIDSRMNGKFAVAIRSAVSQNDRVWLYAGVGIVADSQPQREWDETALKFKPMLNALGAQIDVRA